jgi:hypothetical protein
MPPQVVYDGFLGHHGRLAQDTARSPGLRNWSRSATCNGSTLLAALDRLRADTKRSRIIRLNKKILLDWISAMSN